jgi:ABC-type multidrug transport system ATPase subunit
MGSAIHIEEVSKRFGDVQALKDISLDVEPGELFGLIGPDGAGKTTLFRILTSLFIPDTGSARVAGYDVVKEYREVRKIVGYMPGRFSLYYDLSVEENLAFFATIFGTTIQENYELIQDIYIQIEPFKRRRAGQLSGGMKQKLALSCALIHKPEVLVLDEPTTGVDAVSRKEFWEMLKKLKAQGITIIVSTPYMDEASLCDRVALIQKGGIMQVNTPQAIVEKFEHPLYGISAPDMPRLLNDLRNRKGIHSAHRFGDSIHVALEGLIDAEALKSQLEEAQNDSVDIRRIDPGIEDCFMALMTRNNDG